jgi:peptidoglycan/xylan/chitin deacetylase (PgdA/CDA1 family)
MQNCNEILHIFEKKNIINFLSKISFINNYYVGNATIFMLHRVFNFENDKLLANENMKVSPDFLESFIVELQKQNYEFISLDKLYNILKKKKDFSKKIVFTLDDGYKDNFDIAYPIFKKYNVPFTIYLTTSFPNKSVILWWYVLEQLIIENDYLIVENKKYYCQTYHEKNRSFLEIRKIILKLNQKNLLQELNNIFSKYKIDWFNYNNNLCMTWEQIEILSKEQLCTIAGHTVNHFAFNQLSEDEIIDEINMANQEIENKTNAKVKHFAFPFGGIDEVGHRELKIVEKFNFKTVTTTRKGNIYMKHRNYLNCCLPRIMLRENFNLKDIGKIRRKRIALI